jgi:hypothetical protein
LPAVDWRAIEWERAGWTADLIESVARKTGNKPLTYHEKCFATEFANGRRRSRLSKSNKLKNSR